MTSPANVNAYLTSPGSPNYYALPAMGDARLVLPQGWFARPEIQADFAKYGRGLAEPKTQKELLEVAQFFQGLNDGKTVYGASIFTERGSEGITMQKALCLGLQIRKHPGATEGAVNSPPPWKPLNSTRALQDRHALRL